MRNTSLALRSTKTKQQRIYESVMNELSPMVKKFILNELATETYDTADKAQKLNFKSVDTIDDGAIMIQFVGVNKKYIGYVTQQWNMLFDVDKTYVKGLTSAPLIDNNPQAAANPTYVFVGITVYNKTTSHYYVICFEYEFGQLFPRWIIKGFGESRGNRGHSLVWKGQRGYADPLLGRRDAKTVVDVITKFFNGNVKIDGRELYGYGPYYI